MEAIIAEHWFNNCFVGLPFERFTGTQLMGPTN